MTLSKILLCLLPFLLVGSSSGSVNQNCLVEGTCRQNPEIPIVHDDTSTDLLQENNTSASNQLLVADCRDEKMDCKEWAQQGYCEDPKHGEFMKTTCRKSCPNVCDKGEFDWGEPQQADDPKTRYTIAQSLEYLHTVVHEDPEYHDIKSSCKNKHELCSYWASTGECENNERYMKYNCAPACQSCGALDHKIRCKWDPNGPQSVGPGDLGNMFERITTNPEYQKYSPTILSQPSDDPEQDGPWVVQFENFISEEEADMLIDAGGVRGYYRSEGGSHVDNDNGEYISEVSDYRTSFQAWCVEDCYQDPIAIRVSDRIANLTGIAEPHSEYLQLLKYGEGQYYKTHSDFIEHHVDRPMGPRVLTLYMYLNDTPEGGGTRFPNLGDGLTVTPKRGRAVMWPSVLDQDPFMRDERTDHEALPVMKGVKYGANAWLHVGDFKDAYKRQCST